MLSKKYRIRKLKEFEAIFKKSYSCYNSLLGIKSAKNLFGFSRLGIIISTKVSKKAVTRNLIKRRLRFLANKLLPELKTGFDIIIIVLPPSVEADYPQIEAALVLSLKKLRLFKENGN